MAVKLVVCICICLITLLCGIRCQVTKPGLKGRVTQKGLDYVRDIALDFLMAELVKLEIPDISESVGPADIYINNVQVLSIDRPESKIEPVPDWGLRWTASEINPRIQAEYTAKANLGPLKMTKTGTVTVVGKGMTFDAKFFIGREMDGRPSVDFMDCSSDGDVTLSFRGGLSGILNLGSRWFKTKVRSLIQAQICFQAKKEINEKAAWALSKFPVTQVIFDGFLLDYHLTQFPQFKPGYLEAFIKGEIRHSTDTQRPNFKPPTIKSYDDHVDKMVYVYVTNYLLNSGLQSAYNVGKIRVSIGSEVDPQIPIPDEVLDYFKTTCPQSACLGTIFPQITLKYPNADVEMDAFATEAPWLDIDNGVLGLEAWLQADLFAVDESGRHPLFSIYSNVSSELTVSLSGNRLIFNVTEINPEIEVSGGMVEDPGTGFFFEALARLAVQQVLRPKLAEIGSEGIELPDLQDVTFIDPQVLGSESSEGVLVVATDIRYELPSP